MDNNDNAYLYSSHRRQKTDLKIKALKGSRVGSEMPGALARFGGHERRWRKGLEANTSNYCFLLWLGQTLTVVFVCTFHFHAKVSNVRARNHRNPPHHQTLLSASPSELLLGVHKQPGFTQARKSG